MKLTLFLLGLVLLSSLDAASLKSKKQKLISKFQQYTVSGVISLPYAEVQETFTAYLDSSSSSSRIDYYDGMVVTIQVGPAYEGDGGVAAQRVPITTEQVRNQKTCFWMNGTADAPTSPQSVFPDLTNFIFAGQAVYKGANVDSWTSVETDGGKTNTYTFYVNSVTQEPVFYQMMGYDTLIGSHYDKYNIEYYNYNEDSIPTETFDIPESWNCIEFDQVNGPSKGVLLNPMREFIHNDQTHVHSHFEDFKNKHNREYENHLEHQKRLHVFRQNLRYINSVNRKGLSYKLAINHLADKTDEEIAVLRGRKSTKNLNLNSLKHVKQFDKSEFDQTDLPESFDWRIIGAVSPVKDQGICGSCWSFSTSEAIEGAYFLKYNKMVRFSEQALMDCSWGYGNNACDGGLDFLGYEWIIDHGGIPTEDSYGQYLQADGECHYEQATVGAQLTGYVNITPYDINILKTALVNQGPISIAIDASHKSLSFYASGVYFEPSCGNTPDALDHAVLLVGYGTLNGEDYWLVKNSWSTYWGNDGYVLMSQRDNNCGVLTSTTYPIVA